METTTHKLLDIVSHIWPILTGIAAFFIGWWKLSRNDKKAKEKRITNLETIVQHLNDVGVTSDELHQCREDVRKEDDRNLDIIFNEIHKERGSNALQHSDINKKIDTVDEKLQKIYEHLLNKKEDS